MFVMLPNTMPYEIRLRETKVLQKKQTDGRAKGEMMAKTNDKTIELLEKAKKQLEAETTCIISPYKSHTQYAYEDITQAIALRKAELKE